MIQIAGTRIQHQDSACSLRGSKEPIPAEIYAKMVEVALDRRRSTPVRRPQYMIENFLTYP
jgi:hypothetical protein